MRNFGFSSDKVESVAHMTFEEAPTSATSEANVQTLRTLLLMSDKQV